MALKNTLTFPSSHGNKFNKSTAFTKEERIKFKLLDKLPFAIENTKQQLCRIHLQLNSLSNADEKSKFLMELYYHNQSLFYAFAVANLREVMPLIYTPQVAKRCSSFSEEFKYPLGTYIAYPDRHHLATIVANVVNKNIKLIVVTDGERVLGIGDQGVGGIHIALGKLMLYTILGGIDPNTTLALVLDVGTNNNTLLTNPIYLGWRHRRISDKKYYQFIDQFVAALKKSSSSMVLHWEDFSRDHAWTLLNRYQRQLPSFNDDIQGTAAVTLAAILAAMKLTKSTLGQHRIVILGAGSTALGLVKLLLLYAKKIALEEKEFKQNLWLVDKEGLLTDRLKNLTELQGRYIKKSSTISSWKIKNPKNITLEEVIKYVKPTILIGFSTAPHSFTKTVVRTMAKYVSRPIIFPLSNPSDRAEAHPRDLVQWTKAKAIIATGSPFAPLNYRGKKIEITQCNNALVFPGVIKGILAKGASTIEDEVFLTAALTLFKLTPMQKKNLAPLLLPALEKIPAVSKIIAKNICLKN